MEFPRDFDQQTVKKVWSMGTSYTTSYTMKGWGGAYIINPKP